VRVNLFLTTDLKVFLPGAGLALVAGLLLGGAMQPHLDTDDSRPAGPQIIADAGGHRADGISDSGAMLAAYGGRTPDYVLGTDWKNAMTWPDERASVSASAREVVLDDATPTETPATLTRVTYVEPPASPHVYPSLAGAGPSVHAATDADVAANDDTLPAEKG
jgi:hypothetical protein